MWREVAGSGEVRAGHRWWSALIPPVVAAVLLFAAGAVRLAIPVLVIGVSMAVIGGRWPRWGERFQGLFHRIGSGVGLVLRFALLGVVAVFVIAPISFVQWVLPMSDRFGSATGVWEGLAPERTRDPGAESRHLFLVEARAVDKASRSLPRRVVAAVPLAVGVVIAVLAIDLAVGAVVGRVADLGEGSSSDLAGGTDGASPVDSPAMASYPWRGDYFAALDHLRYDYQPYALARVDDTQTPYINVSDGVRRSFEVAAPGARVPEVWFFGGSTLWGEGQRDLHTIPSEFARRAGADGRPVRVVNFGQPGNVSWQDALLFEQALAHRPPPDLAVFYDGVNDYRVQTKYPANDPIHFEFRRVSKLVTGHAPGEVGTRVTRESVGGDLGHLFDRYVETSVVAKLIRQARSVVASAPVSAGQTVDSSESDASDPVANAAEVYGRSQAVIRLLAGRDGVDSVFFWQPQQGGGDAYRDLTDRVAGSAIDLTEVLDDPPAPVYVDESHTNEVGARLVAEAMWQRLRSRLGASGVPPRTGPDS